MQRKIQKANSTATVLHFLKFFIILATLIAVIIFSEVIETELVSLIEANLDDLRENPHLIWIASVSLYSPLLFAGSCYLSIGAKVRKEQRYPYRNQCVALDTRIREGRPAMLRARLLLLGGFLCLIGGAVAAVWTALYIISAVS